MMSDPSNSARQRPNARRSAPRFRQRNALMTLVAALTVGATIHAGLSLWSRRLPAYIDPQFTAKSNSLAKRVAKASAGTPLVLMLGSSRTVWGFKGKPVEDSVRQSLDQQVIAYEFGMSGRGPTMSWVTLQRLRNMRIRPDIVLLEIHPAFLTRSFGLERPRYLETERAALASFGFPEPEPDAGTPPQAQWYCYRHLLLGQTRRSWLQPRTDWDWYPALGKWGTNDSTRNKPNIPAHVERARSQYFDSLQTLELGRPAERLLEEIVATCRRDEIAIALVRSPEGPTFRSWYPPAARQQVRVFLRDLTDRLGVPLIDAWEWFDDDAFSDSHHFTNDGAIEYSSRLAREVVVPLLRERSGMSPAVPYRTTSLSKVD